MPLITYLNSTPWSQPTTGISLSLLENEFTSDPWADKGEVVVHTGLVGLRQMPKKFLKLVLEVWQSTCRRTTKVINTFSEAQITNICFATTFINYELNIKTENNISWIFQICSQLTQKYITAQVKSTQCVWENYINHQ